MTTLGEMFEAPMQEIHHAYVTISFARPDGDGTFSSTYDMCSAVDIGTINGNLNDGYRITSLTIQE